MLLCVSYMCMLVLSSPNGLLSMLEHKAHWITLAVSRLCFLHFHAVHQFCWSFNGSHLVMFQFLFINRLLLNACCAKFVLSKRCLTLQRHFIVVCRAVLFWTCWNLCKTKSLHSCLFWSLTLLSSNIWLQSVQIHFLSSCWSDSQIVFYPTSLGYFETNANNTI